MGTKHGSIHVDEEDAFDYETKDAYGHIIVRIWLGSIEARG